MRFKFMGKRKLLKILREKSNKSNISLKDVSYTTEDRFEGWRQETILLIEESEKTDLANAEDVYKKLKTVFCLGDGGGGLTEDRHEGNV